jgi:hypothetical protein
MSTGTVSSVGPAFNVDTIGAALIRAHLNGGGTISITGLDYAGSGILVAIPENGTRIHFGKGGSGAALKRWIRDNVSAITGNPAPFFNPRYFGIWTDPATGITHLDIVEAFPREEFDAAIAAGIARNQIAIYDNGRGELYATGGVE